MKTTQPIDTTYGEAVRKGITRFYDFEYGWVTARFLMGKVQLTDDVNGCTRMVRCMEELTYLPEGTNIGDMGADDYEDD